MDKDSLDQIAERLASLESKLEGVGAPTWSTAGDLRSLLDEVTLLRRRVRLLLKISQAAVNMYVAGISLRGLLQDLNTSWPDWQRDLDILEKEFSKDPKKQP